MTEAEKEQLINWQVGLAATGGSQSLLCELIEIFLIEYPKQLAGIAEALGKGSGKEVRLFAHTLKGSLRFFGESRASTLTSELETMGLGDRLEGADGLLAELRLEVARLPPELQNYLDTHS